MKTSTFTRNPLRELPDGRIVRMFPFHLSLEGDETRVLCRDEEDYDAFVKILIVCARRKDIALVAYGIVSNHAHAVFLSEAKTIADKYGDDVKKMFSMFFKRKYGEGKIMKRKGVSVLWIDSDWYLRNAIAYDIRNAMDNCAVSIEEYPWTSYSAYFRSSIPEGKPVKALTHTEKRRIMHTGDDLTNIPWMIDNSERLIPGSICDTRYAESAFENNPSMFHQKLGTSNTAEMSRRLDENPRHFRKDEEVLRNVNYLSNKWFSTLVTDLPYEQKARLLSYYYRSNRTSVPQMARVFGVSKNEITAILKKNGEL